MLRDATLRFTSSIIHVWRYASPCDPSRTTETDMKVNRRITGERFSYTLLLRDPCTCAPNSLNT